MEQQIRFCTTSDGVRIAYATVGKGPPLVRVLGWFTHLEFEWDYAITRNFNHLLSTRHLLIRYDGRGQGLSDRNIQDFSTEADVRDLEAVIDALNLERVALYGISQGGQIAISYAVRHPERVSHLILYGSFALTRMQQTEEGRKQIEAMLTLMRQGWDSDLPVYRQLFTGLLIPDADAEAIQAFNELGRVSASAENAVALVSAGLTVDVTELLQQVQVPTLVAHRRGDAGVPFESGRELAALIPGARLLPLEGRNHVILPDEPEGKILAKAIEEFVGAGEETTDKAQRLAPEHVHTILFTDVEGSTALTQRLGDTKARELLREHERMVREALKAHGGSEVKTMGDGFMASFSSATKALECAIAMQRAFAAHNESAEEPIMVRVGLNAGEPIAEDDDLFGTAVNEAAKITAAAEGGQILVANVVRELAKGKDFLFADRGETSLKGFDDPVRLYEVRGGA